MEPVTLYVYDLSNGLAKALSLGMAGIQIDGVWHSSIKIYGREYCYGQGIESFQPGTIHQYGKPVQMIEMGTTEIDEAVWDEYLDNMRTVWTKEKYHLLDNNCNSFTEEVCQFLCGKSIPKHVFVALTQIRSPVYPPNSSQLPSVTPSDR